MTDNVDTAIADGPGTGARPQGTDMQFDHWSSR